MLAAVGRCGLSGRSVRVVPVRHIGCLVGFRGRRIEGLGAGGGAG